MLVGRNTCSNVSLAPVPYEDLRGFINRTIQPEFSSGSVLELKGVTSIDLSLFRAILLTLVTSVLRKNLFSYFFIFLKNIFNIL